MMVMVDETTGNKYMRAVDHKGLGDEGNQSWLVKDMHQELKSWGHPGGGANALILKSDGEPAIVAVREALAAVMGAGSPLSCRPLVSIKRTVQPRRQGVPSGIKRAFSKFNSRCV